MVVSRSFGVLVVFLSKLLGSLKTGGRETTVTLTQEQEEATSDRVQ